MQAVETNVVIVPVTRLSTSALFYMRLLGLSVIRRHGKPVNRIDLGSTSYQINETAFGGAHQILALTSVRCSQGIPDLRISLCSLNELARIWIIAKFFGYATSDPRFQEGNCVLRVIDPDLRQITLVASCDASDAVSDVDVIEQETPLRRVRTALVA